MSQEEKNIPVEQQRLDLRLMDGETARNTFRFQWEDPALRFQTDLWSGQWYELNGTRTEQSEGSAGAALDTLLADTLKANGIPVSFLRMLPVFSALSLFSGVMFGLLSGIGSTPFFAPIALKTLISNEPLEETERLLSSIKLDKDDYHLLRYYNMMVINRPASLFLQ